MELYLQLVHLLILAIPVACIAWTVTHEEVFREPRDFCVNSMKSARSFIKRKFFYLFTCEYCFSHYVALLMLAITRYHLLYPDWRGYLVSFFSLVWMANIYMALYAKIRIEIKKEKIEIAEKEQEVKSST